MVATRYVYGKGRLFFRKTLAIFAFVFGFFAPYFTTAPKLWSPGSSSNNLSAGLFSLNTAHAEVPVAPGFADGDVSSAGASDASASSGPGPDSGADSDAGADGGAGGAGGSGADAT
ncbi:MAG: hypothetical protein WC217_00375 [Candidatus Paceibacterota bacterium]|jgi:hypothetical protein